MSGSVIVGSARTPIGKLSGAFADFTAMDLGVIGVSLVIMLVLYLFFTRTKTGTAMRATAQSQTAARLMGVSVPRIFSLTWAISAGVGGFAGVLIAPIVYLDPNLGVIGVKAFAGAPAMRLGDQPRSTLRPSSRATPPSSSSTTALTGIPSRSRSALRRASGSPAMKTSSTPEATSEAFTWSTRRSMRARNSSIGMKRSGSMAR